MCVAREQFSRTIQMSEAIQLKHLLQGKPWPLAKQIGGGGGIPANLSPDNKTPRLKEIRPKKFLRQGEGEENYCQRFYFFSKIPQSLKIK